LLELLRGSENERLRESGIAWAKRFKWEATAKRTFQIYEEAIRSFKSRGGIRIN